MNVRTSGCNIAACTDVRPRTSNVLQKGRPLPSTMHVVKSQDHNNIDLFRNMYQVLLIIKVIQLREESTNFCHELLMWL